MLIREGYHAGSEWGVLAKHEEEMWIWFTSESLRELAVMENCIWSVDMRRG